jgi:undecaprenyl-diphosphatase
MSIFEALILGLIQGFTEFIPVSSSGHLLLAQEIFGSEESSLAFDVVLHVGTLAALLIYFHKEVFSLVKNVFKKSKDGALARLILLATIPAAAAGLLFADFIDENLRSPLVVVITLSSVGVLMLVVEKYAVRKEPNDISKKQGLSVGFAQTLALIPGVSRSGITITTGMLAGMGRVQAARFSFLLAIPIIAGSAFGVLLRDGDSLSFDGALIIGMLASFVSGIIAIKFLLSIIGHYGLKPFAYYRIILALIVLVFLL